MPIAMIHIAAGRTAEQRQRMAEEVTEAIARTLDAPSETVRVVITEVDREAWFSGGISLARRSSQARRSD